MPSRPFTPFALVAAAVLLAGCQAPAAPPPATGNSGSGAASSGPGGGGAAVPGTARTARTQLAALRIGSWHPMKGYSRARFHIWAEHPGGCDTRELVLKRQGSNVRSTASSCHPVSGRWTSPYDGKVVTVPGALDIDHVVPLANAWRSGADQWDDAQRTQFANDLRDPQLLAVSATTNRAKGDQGPEAWRPPQAGYWCTYARSWIAVKYTFKLSVTQAEHDALLDMLKRC